MIGAIEQAIVDRINAASSGGSGSALGYGLKKVISYGGEFDADIKQVIKDFPAVWVIFAGRGRPVQRTTGLWRADLRFTVMCGTRNRRNERARRRGTAAGEVGSYQIVEDVEALLVGQTFGLNIDPIEPAGVRSLFQSAVSDRQVSLYAIDLTIRVDIQTAEPAGGLDDFTTFNAEWDIPVFDPTLTLPAPPGKADATDTTTLET